MVSLRLTSLSMLVDCYLVWASVLLGFYLLRSMESSMMISDTVLCYG
jgi:hypothetical protein